MRTSNSEETTKEFFLKRDTIDMLRWQSTWNHIKCSIKTRQVKKRGEDKKETNNNRESVMIRKQLQTRSNYIGSLFKCE